MKSFLPSLVLLATHVLASSSARPRQDTKQLQITVQQVKTSSESDIVVTDKETSQVLGHTCSDTLNSGAFANFPIIADIDQNGVGNITVGTKTYRVHENPEISGGITCNRIYNDVESITTCNIPVPASLALTSVENADRPDCFKTATLPSLQSIPLLISSATIPAPTEIGSLTAREVEQSLEERQTCGIWSSYTALDGDGNPHQNYYNTQLSQNMLCDSLGCSVGSQNSESITVGWTASASAAGWISGGFGVTVTWTTGNSYTCNGNPGDTICVWYNTANTAYTVQNYNYNQCTGAAPYGDPFVMFSPNINNVGGYYYCVVGTCRNQAAAYWNYNGPAGGPQ